MAQANASERHRVSLRSLSARALRWVPTPPQRNDDPPATPPMLERWVSRSPPVPMLSRVVARGRKPFSSDVLATTRSTKGSSSLKCRPLLTYLPAHGPSECFQAPRFFLFVARQLEPCAGCPPPHSATATLLPHPQCLSAGCRGRPLYHTNRDATALRN